MKDKGRQGRQRKQWTDDLKERSGLTIPDLVSFAEDGGTYRRFADVVARAR